MAKVIFFGVDLHGHVNPTLGLIHKLIERGEEVVYYCSDAFQDKIEQTGATFRSYRGLLGFGTNDGTGIDTFMVFADFIVNKSHIIIEALQEEVTQWQPDYIIHDAFSLWGKQFAEQLGIPGISVFANFPFIDEMADLDPDFFMEYVLRAADDPIYKKYKGQHDMYRKLLDKLSRMLSIKHGLHNVNVINDIFCSKEALNILFTSREFQIYADAFDESHLFAGYSLYSRTESVEFPYEQLDGRPLIYIAFGTIYNELEEIYKTCLEAFGSREHQVILSVGNKINLQELGEIPDNFIVRPYVPQLEILKRADVFISHGGANSIYEGLCNHVPLVVMPQVFDEYMGALMVEKAGAGIYLRQAEVSAAELKEAVEQVLMTPSYRDNCCRIKQSFEATGGLDYAVDGILKFAKQRVAHETL
ncbi:macrolide family glycosyltransferase [Paenibacillus sp. FJAT-26967]|uniref:macrolide family glycosyltransferase n=1 Tax=Paenibacillus sp. FJAT-26967 TaxID=1729690 RepID=UPI000837AB6C|nr:macrolide family glycosyltransferase [Paenibacillus sp. FJAT-26967]